MQGLQLADYDFDLPESRIAQQPLADRAASKLLLLAADGQIHDLQFRDIVTLLRPGDVLVMNDTRVTARRLFGRKIRAGAPDGAAIEALLLHRTSERTYEALVRPAKRLDVGAAIQFDLGLTAEVVDSTATGGRVLRFSGDTDPGPIIEERGEVPLPPYIREALADPERYQTVYRRDHAEMTGSAAAPTAGLHFTPELLDQLDAMGVQRTTVTLDVGIDTFRPVNVDDVATHTMHGETCRISEAAAEVINGRRGRLIAVGTTSVRTLESFARDDRTVSAGFTKTQIFLYPGVPFRCVDGMFTNFHLPRTTMLMMIAALAGYEPIMSAYRHALTYDYRFLSFGDSMLILAKA
ncbi:MAG: tRNA preQ1(34) S-adenosylmethionine ribosyltransferase-isomerase QueA [Fimbriimonadaceae bacterium]|nr:tRNA preQ1(34) S-adenosylmethionine ribosyltransferase-isomerase QueA [Fimbriimonadaceae bacterium]